jgi:two-component system, LytTR family, response regulator
MFSTYEIPLSFRLFKRTKHIILATLFGVLFYQLSNLLRPDFGDLKPLFAKNYLTYIKDLLGFYVFIEWISVALFFGIALLYINFFKLHILKTGWPNLLIFNLKFLPCIFIAVLLFGPVTNGIRYLLIYQEEYSWSSYFPEYFMQSRMYIRYLVPLFFLGLGYLNYNIFLDYNDWQKARFKEKLRLSKTTGSESSQKYLQKLKVYDQQGELFMPLEEIIYIEVVSKHYKVYTESGVTDTKMSLQELEEKLDPKRFFRINRSTIIHLAHLKNYSYWEYDKYILRLKNMDREFVMQRNRLKDLKEIIG